MTHKTIERFMEYASMKMPSLIRPANEQKKLREVYPDYALLVFDLPNPMEVSYFIDEADDIHGLKMMYHHLRSRQTDYGQSFCFFQEPGYGQMFQMDCSTNSRGRITRIDIKLYASMERMLVELRQQLIRIATVPGEFASAMSEPELISHFL